MSFSKLTVHEVASLVSFIFVWTGAASRYALLCRLHRSKRGGLLALKYLCELYRNKVSASENRTMCGYFPVSGHLM